MNSSMAKTNTDAHAGMIPNRVAFVKEWRDDVLCFVFHGASIDIIDNTFRSLEGICSSEVTTETVNEMTNGRCHKNIVVRIFTTDIQEKELADMVVHLLKKKDCDVTCFSDMSKFLNT